MIRMHGFQNVVLKDLPAPKHALESIIFNEVHIVLWIIADIVTRIANLMMFEVNLTAIVASVKKYCNLQLFTLTAYRITLQCTSNDSSVLSSKRVCKKCSVSRKLESIEWCTKMWHGLDWLVESSADANNRSTYTKSNMWTSDTGHWTGTHNINQQSIVPNHVNILPKTTSDNSAQHIKKC